MCDDKTEGSHDKPIFFLAIMVGPNMTGKSSFAKLAAKIMNEKMDNFSVEVLQFLTNSANEIIYQVKIATIQFLRTPRSTKCQKLFIVDAPDMHDPHERFTIFQFCMLLDMIYLQVHMEFNPIEIVNRCAEFKLPITLEYVQQPGFFNASSITMEREVPFQYNCITIPSIFIRDLEYEVFRLKEFMFSCVMPPLHVVWKMKMPEDPAYSNPSQHQMRAGKSDKDTVWQAGKDTVMIPEKDEPNIHPLLDF